MCAPRSQACLEFDLDVRFGQAHLSRADGFDLRTLQRESRFELFEQKIFKASLAVGGNNFDLFSHKTIVT